MKKGFIFVLVVALTIFTELPALGAVKVGEKCAKLGATSIYKGKKFTCIKSGKKLVWNKGYVLKVAPKLSIAPSPNPSDSPSPTPAPSPSPKPNSETTHTPSPEATPSPTPKATGPIAAITFDNLEVEWVNLTARKEVLRVYESAKPLVGAYEVIAGPNVVTAQIDEEKRLLDIAARMFSGYFKPEKYQVVFFSEKDGPWADQALATYGGGFPYKIVEEIAKNPNGCNFAFATIGKNLMPIYYQCLYTGGRHTNDKQTAIHEYFHLVQNKYATKGGIPCWAHEGSPQYFGMALGVDGTDPSGLETLKFTRNLSYAFNPGGPSNLPPNRNLIDRVQTLNGFLEVMHLSEAINTNCMPLASYAVGSILTEVLIAVKSFDTYMDFVKSFAEPTAWKANFQRIYGLSVDDFYTKTWPYFRARLDVAYKTG